MNKYIALLRPFSWVKNTFVFAPLFFAFQFNDIVAWASSTIAALCFLLASSAVYIFNDIWDIEEDKAHPIKKNRPIAAGKITIKSAYIIAALLALFTALISISFLPYICQVILAAYLAIQILYTLKLKHIAVIDVMVIAFGFVLRVLVGSHAINVTASPWIILTTYLLALFLGFAKRYHELNIVGYKEIRTSLKTYSKQLLNSLIAVSCVSTLIAYTLYSIEIGRLSGQIELIYTVIFVVFGLLRYLQILYIDKKSGEPEKILFQNKLFLVNLMLWLLTTLWILS